jgi:hypothetical protein
MTNAIDANGNTVTNTSNLAPNNDLRATGRDIQAEKVADGRYSKVSTYINDDEANNNPNVIIRDGSRQHVSGGYRPDDLVRVGGMDMQYETAVSLGLIQGDTVTTPQERFMADSENNPNEAPTDPRPPAAQLLESQIELAMGDVAPAVLDTFAKDIVTYGDLSEEGFAFAQSRLGMSEQAVRSIYSEMQEAGGDVLSDFMEVGDGLGSDRIAFLVDRAEYGTRQEQEIVRGLWVKAATGKLTRAAAVQAFDRLYRPYD